MNEKNIYIIKGGMIVERSLFLNRKFFFAILTIFVFVFGMQMLEPTSAAKWKLVSKDSKYTDQGFKISWKVTKKGNSQVIVKGISYAYDEKVYSTVWLKKISKTKLKLIQKLGNDKKQVFYIKTRLSAVQFYWKQRHKGNYHVIWS